MSCTVGDTKEKAAAYELADSADVGEWFIAAVDDGVNLKARYGSLPQGDTAVEFDAEWEARV